MVWLWLRIQNISQWAVADAGAHAGGLGVVPAAANVVVAGDSGAVANHFNVFVPKTSKRRRP